MPIDTSSWKTLVFGRFMIRAPQDALSAGTYRLWNDHIDQRKDLTNMELLKQEVAAKQAEFKSQKHVNFGTRYINTYDLKGKGISVWGYLFDSASSINGAHYATVYAYYFSTKPFKVWTVKREFSLGDGTEQKELDYEHKLAQAIRPLQDDGEVPKEAGFVIDGGMLAGDEYRAEDADFSFWTPAFLRPNPKSPSDGFAGLSITTFSIARATETTFFQRLDKGHATLMALLSSGKELRKREMVLNGIAGQEYLYRTTSERSDWTEYHFAWVANGKVEDNYQPDVAVRFDMSTPSLPKLPPHPFKSDEEAIAFWDATLGTLQLRPVTTAAEGSKTSQADAPTKVGQTCPASGVWEASLPLTHASARNLATSPSRLVTVQKGQPMPEVYARFMFPQTADADNAAIAWTLVHPA